MKKRSLAFAALFSFFVLPLAAQSFSERLAHAVDSFDHNYPQEKIFVHTDRSAYTAGESIWLKAYVTMDGTPSILSRVVYVELVNERNEVVEKRMLPAVNGSAFGDIFINNQYPTGSYSLNAYTLWMKNFPDYIFKKPIAIYNTDHKGNVTLPKADFTVQFLPEGGEMITGLQSRIAFKATSLNGLPLDIKGEIHDSKNNKIATLSTLHDGMGNFEFTPAPGETYKAVFPVSTGSFKTFQLPAAKGEGIVLNVNNESAARIFFSLQRGENNSAKYNKVLLAGRMNNTLLYSANLNFDEGLSAGAINKKNFPSGILQLTVFSEEGLPLAERLVFISNYQLPQSRLHTDTLSVRKRSKNTFTINLSEFKNISASVSVTNFSADSTAFDDNLLTSLLLTSEIKGHVNNPAYYFKDTSPETLKHLDLLLLTHGWRRFNIQQIAAYQFPTIKFPIESDIAVQGKITRYNGKTLANSRMDFITKTEDSTTILSTINLAANDHFALTGLDFKKSATIYYQGANANKENAAVKVTLLPSFFDTLQKSTHHFSTLNMQGSLLGMNNLYDRLLQMKRELEKAEGKMLGEVVVRTKKPSITDSLSKIYVNDLFVNSDHTISTLNKNVSNIWQFLRFQIGGLEVGIADGETTVFLRNNPQTNNFEESVSNLSDSHTNLNFFLNEIQVSKDLIESINPEDIVLVKVWKGTSAYTVGSDRGIIAIYTDKTKANKSWTGKGFDAFKKMGYSVSREFFSMDYSKISPESSFADYRPTLFWNHSLKPDKEGNAKISFYNDDEARKFKVVVQGIDENGKVLSIHKIVE